MTTIQRSDRYNAASMTIATMVGGSVAGGIAPEQAVIEIETAHFFRQNNDNPDSFRANL